MMKASKYLPLAEEARRSGTEERWGVWAKDPRATVPNCKFCNLSSTIRGEYSTCYICPVYENNRVCCSLYTGWLHTTDTDRLKRIAAQMVEYLNSLDLVAWTRTLIADGLLEDDLLSKHEDGERFTGTVWEYSPRQLKEDEYLVYTGELRPYKNGDWVAYNNGKEALWADHTDRNSCEILRVESYAVSKHKAGEHFNDEWDFAGVKKRPEPRKDRWLYRGCVCYASEVSQTVGNGYREILIPRLKWKVGDKVWCTGFVVGLPEREFELKEGVIIGMGDDIGNYKVDIQQNVNWIINESQLSPIPENPDIDHDPAYLKALEDSIEHHKDGASRTKENWKEFQTNSACRNCAVCLYFGYDINIPGEVPDCKSCFLDDRREDGIDLCSVEWNAMDNAKNFEDYIKAERALLARIEAEYARVKGIQHPKEPETPKDKEPAKYEKGQPVVYEGLIWEHVNTHAVTWVNAESNETGKTVYHTIRQPGTMFETIIQEHNIRPAVPKDYERSVKVDGKEAKVRVYEDENGNIRVVTEDDYWNLDKDFTSSVILIAGLKVLGIPTIPYSVSKGVYDRPEK